MFIGGLSWNTSTGKQISKFMKIHEKMSKKQKLNSVTFLDSLKKYFSRFGELKEAMVMTDLATKRSRSILL